MMSPDAVIAIGSALQRHWGHTGYSLDTLAAGPSWGSAIAEVVASDGSRFAVGSDRWGRVQHADTVAEVSALLIAVAQSELVER